MPLVDALRAISKGFGEATGNTAAVQDIDKQEQQKQNDKLLKLQMQVAPLTYAAQGIQAQLAPLIDPATGKPTPENQQRYDQLVDQLSDIIQRKRAIFYPPPKEDAHGLGYLLHTATDKAHITSHAVEQARAAHKKKADEFNAKAKQQAQQEARMTVEGVVPSALSPEAIKDKAALELETKKEEARQKIEDAREAARQKEDDARQAAADQREREREKLSDEREKEQERRFEENQRAIESRFERSQARQEKNAGTWSVAEGEGGETKLFNSKTGEMRDAPEGLHKSGYYAKNIAPLDAANLNIDDYMKNGVFDGAGDLSLQHEFFTATQPSAGFRMTKVQQDILQNSQSWLNSAEAKALHAKTGVWFSPTLRQQIADAAQKAIAAKKAVLQGGPKSQQLQQTQGGNNPNVIVVSPEDMK